MSPFGFESSSARDGEMSWIILHRGGGTIFGFFFVVVLGIFFTMSNTATRASPWPSRDFNFLWRQFRGGDMSLYGKWVCIWPYMGTPKRRGFLGWIKLNTPYYCYDMLQVYKALHNIHDIKWHDMFSLATCKTRGHSLKLSKKGATLLNGYIHFHFVLWISGIGCHRKQFLQEQLALLSHIWMTQIGRWTKIIST